MMEAEKGTGLKVTAEEMANGDEEYYKILLDYQNDNITLMEMQQRLYYLKKIRLLPRLMEYRKNEQWEEFISLALACYEVMPEAFEYYKEIPEELKRSFALQAYLHHGDSIPKVRKAVRELHPASPQELPPEIADKEIITIYRAGEEDITKCKNRLSWTTSLKTAEFFYNEYIRRHANYLYQAEIKTSNIIAFINDRKENEIIQYRKVFNIIELDKKEGR